jgi:hypothetical protein
MFVPVACSACGKPFQVPDAALGKPTACPWCQAAVIALPVAGAPVPPVVQPVAAKSDDTPAPLSLDDDAPPRKSSRPNLWLVILALLLVAVIATAVTIGALRRKEGYLVGREWRSFTPPDNSCAVELLGRPKEDTEGVESGQRRYKSEGWYSGTTAWIAWRNLSAAEAQMAATDDAWHNPQLVKLFEAERDWLKDKYGGYLTKDATIKFKDPLTREVRFEYPHGRAVERMIVMPAGPRPRIYFIGIAGKRLDLDGDEARHLFDSLRVFE